MLPIVHFHRSFTSFPTKVSQHPDVCSYGFRIIGTLLRVVNLTIYIIYIFVCNKNVLSIDFGFITGWMKFEKKITFLIGFISCAKKKKDSQEDGPPSKISYYVFISAKEVSLTNL